MCSIKLSLLFSAGSEMSSGLQALRIWPSVLKIKGVHSFLWEIHCWTTDHHLPYGIAQSQLPRNTGECILL